MNERTARALAIQRVLAARSPGATPASVRAALALVGVHVDEDEAARLLRDHRGGSR